MKKVILLTILLASAFFTSCEDDAKDPWTIHEQTANLATFVTIAKQNIVIDFTDPNSTFSFTIDAPSSNVASYDLMVSRVSGGVASDTLPLATVNSLPADFDISAGDLATALGLDVADLNAGDRFNFVGSATNGNGDTADVSNLNGDAVGPGQFNAFRFNTFLSCPFNQADAIGTYAVTVDDFGLAMPTFEVTAGSGPNSVIINDLIQPGLSMEMEVNPNTGIGAISRTPMADAFYGYAGGNINTTGTPSFFFSCSGTISAVFQYTVDLGSFGSFAFGAQKQ